MSFVPSQNFQILMKLPVSLVELILLVWKKKKLYKNVAVMSILTDPDNLFDYEKGIYIMGKDYDDWLREDPENANVVYYRRVGNYNRKGRESEIPATIEYFPADENRQGFISNLGIRIMGAVSRTFLQKSFRCTFREEYGEKNLKYELIPGNQRSDGKGPLNKYKTFNIRDGGNDHKFMMYRDKVLQTLVKDRDFETQQQDAVVVYLDGEFWGIYDICEDYNDHYIANNYDIDKKNVIIVKKNVVKDGEESDLALFNKTVDKIYNEDMSIQENYVKISEEFDTEAFAWYSAFHFYIENRDSIFQDNNWALWRVRDPVQNVTYADGKWRFLLYDTESSSGLKYTDYEPPVILGDALNKTSSLAENIGSKLLVSLLENRDFKNLFINALCDMKNIDFAPDKVNPLIDHWNNTVFSVMTDHFDRYGYEATIIEGSANHYQNQVNIFKTWLNGRNTIFMDYLSNVFNFKKAVTVTVTSKDFHKGGFTVNDGKNIFKKQYKGEYFEENILYLTAVPNEGKKFKYWEIKNCKFVDANFNIMQRKKQLPQNRVGVYPSKKCQVVAYFK